METYRPIELLSLEKNDLRKLLIDWEIESYRAQQIFRWIYARSVTEPAVMKNLPIKLRKLLVERTRIGTIRVTAKQSSSDNDAVKFAFSATDGSEFEAVLMENGRRATLCLSTQVGCKLGCLFCATGSMGFTRNLSAGEIVAQYLFLKQAVRQTDARINIVVMGMGEPLLNYANTAKALRILTDEAGANIGNRRITVSTAGVVPAIEGMIQEQAPWRLAISLNAANNELRDQLMPLNRVYPIEQLIDGAHRFARKTRRRVTLEYVLIRGINDSRQDAKQLAKLASQLPCKVNVIPFNPCPGIPYEAPSDAAVEVFVAALYPRCPAVTVRRSKGSTILAACGQLANR